MAEDHYACAYCSKPLKKHDLRECEGIDRDEDGDLYSVRNRGFCFPSTRIMTLEESRRGITGPVGPTGP